MSIEYVLNTETIENKYGWFFCVESYGPKTISVMAVSTAIELASRDEYVYVAAVCLTKDGRPLVAALKVPQSFAVESVLEAEAEQEAKRAIPGGYVPEEISTHIMKRQAALIESLNSGRDDANAIFSPPAVLADDGEIKFEWSQNDLAELARISSGE